MHILHVGAIPTYTLSEVPYKLKTITIAVTGASEQSLYLLLMIYLYIAIADFMWLYMLYFSVYNREYQGLHLTVFIPKCVVWYIMMCIEKFNCIFVCHIRPSLKRPTTMPVLPLPSPCVPYHQLTQVFHTVSLNTKRTPIRYVKIVNHSHFLLSKMILCAYQT